MSSIERVRIRMYDVGFGDCILTSYYYDQPVPYQGKLTRDGNPLAARPERHMLMDFGSTGGAKAADMKVVAERIESDCGGQLDVLAVSHRHKDHMSGFGLVDASAVIDRLNPLLIVRSWTEDPDIPENADAPGSANFVRALDAGQAFAGKLAFETEGQRSNSLRGGLHLAATGQVKNKAAVDNLARWGGLQDDEFLHFGMKSKIEQYIPGTTVRVIGPPTVEQYGEVTGQDDEDPEYWMLRRAFDPEHWSMHRDDFNKALGAVGIDTDAPETLGGEGGLIDPGPVRWLVEKMRGQHIQTLRRIVRDLDDALNNTSLILLIDAGDGENTKRMLLAGDAQIENWRFGLEQADDTVSPSSAECLELLKGVDLYKVGHHGSRNASPRSLVKLWEDKPRTDMVGLMSTKSCFHGKKEVTRVPRQTLVDALAKEMRLFTTDQEWYALNEDNAPEYIEVQADVTAPGPFKLKRGRAGLIQENDVQIDCGNKGH